MSPPPPRWPDHLDAVIAAPEHHRVLLDNASVRVLETRVAPGETVRLHTHRWPATHYFLAAGDMVRRDEHGVVVADSRRAPVRAAAGQAVWSPPLEPHTLENVGPTEIRVISVEIKSGAAEG
jgi:mannose-6-phosphate isomerase-like protein (cupin superfamily)